MNRSLTLLAALVLAPVIAPAQDSAPTPSTGQPRYALPARTLTNVRHGPHERQALDFSQTKKTPDHAPLMFYLHGGAWNYGAKADAVPFPTPASTSKTIPLIQP